MYAHIFVAGTFDRIHRGHEALLVRAFDEGERVIIGITSDTFVAKYKSAPLDSFAPYSVRKHRVEAWLENHKKNAFIIAIDDPYEPAASMADLDAIVVSSETAFRAHEINDIRKIRHLRGLSIITVPMVVAEDRKPISSTRLRNGEIDSNGRLIMPESLRSTLGKPLGRLLRGQSITQSIWRNRDKVIATVGDVATKTLLDTGFIPFLAIIDGKVGRKPYPNVVSQLRKTTSCEARSGPGYISREAIEVIQKVFTHSPIHPSTHHVLVINGEEDLLVLPVLIHAPIGTIIYYGQPGRGLVEVVVTKAKKRQALALLTQFVC